MIFSQPKPSRKQFVKFSLCKVLLSFGSSEELSFGSSEEDPRADANISRGDVWVAWFFFARWIFILEPNR